MATRARGSIPAPSDARTNVAPSPASGLEARVSMASMPPESSGETQVMCCTTPWSSWPWAAPAPPAPRAAAAPRAAIRLRARIGGKSRPAGGRRGPPAVTSRYPAPVERHDDEARRRRIGIVLVVLAIALFIAELVALAFGLLEIAALIFVIFVGGWFALRSYQRRTGRA